MNDFYQNGLCESHYTASNPITLAKHNTFHDNDSYGVTI